MIIDNPRDVAMAVWAHGPDPAIGGDFPAYIGDADPAVFADEVQRCLSSLLWPYATALVEPTSEPRQDKLCFFNFRTRRIK